MPKTTGSLETFSKPRDQELFTHLEGKIPSRNDNIQEPIYSEGYQYTTGSNCGPKSYSSEVLDNRIITEKTQGLTVSSQLPKDRHISQTLPQIKQVSAPQQLLSRSKEVRSLTEIERGSPLILDYDERSDWNGCNKASLVDDVSFNLHTNSNLDERVSCLSDDDTPKHLEESSSPLSIPDSILNPLDCGLRFSAPQQVTPLGQPNHPAETESTELSYKQLKESARLRTSISIDALSRDPQQAVNRAWRVTFTNCKGIRVNVQEEILDDSRRGPLKYQNAGCQVTRT